MTELPPFEPRVFSLAPALEPEEFRRRATSEEGSARGRAWRYGALALAVAALAALVVSDFVSGSSAFWREHQALTSLLTGVILTLIAVFVLERVLASRDRKRWRSVGLMVVRKFEAIEIEEILAIHVLEYRRRMGSEGSLAEEADYLRLLPEALEDPETWCGEEDVLPLEDWLRGIQEMLEEILEIWAPVLIAAPGLAAIADAATDLLTTIRSVNSELRFGAPREPGFDGRWAPDADRTVRLIAALQAHRYACARLHGLVTAYRDRV